MIGGDGSLVALAAMWGGALALLGIAGLLVTALLRRERKGSLPYVGALLLTAAWLFAEIWWGVGSAAAALAESGRNLGWLWFMASIAGQRAPGQRMIGAVGWIYAGLLVITLMTAVVDAALPRASVGPPGVAALLPPLQMLLASGGLVLLHNLFESARGDERRALVLPLAAIALLWAFDLNLYAITYLSGTPALLLETVRPMAALAVVALLGFAAMRPGAQAVRLSRPVTFRSLALAGVAAWLALLALVATLTGWFGSDFGWRAQVGVLALGIAASALLFASPRVRASGRVWIAKHFFEHRYDYRSEWMRFTATLNRSESETAPLNERVVRAIADIVESDGGTLLLADEAGAQDVEQLGEWLRSTARVVQIDQVRSGAAPAEERAVMPDWIVREPSYWAAVPLIHHDRLEGLVLLVRPPLDRALDWEDFDLLRIAGRQAASYLAEARGSQALVESQRFEEFHRRFAFIMHDVKNLASQLGLLARNIERHGDNPAFRSDMIATVQLSSDRLGMLIQRLSQQERVRPARLTPLDMVAIATRVQKRMAAGHQIKIIAPDAPYWALADAEQAEQLIVHLVQNAVDASDGTQPVTLHLSAADAALRVDIIDHGCGMSTEFIRSSLFRPFASTKAGGFGIGAYQARQLAEAMGGTLGVVSREGEGSVFSLQLTRAAAPDATLQEQAA
jgi:putative PEP-CTERM system histidine kinase